MSHAVNAIFHTLQGEGRQAGRAADTEAAARDRMAHPRWRLGPRTLTVLGIA